MVVCRGRGRRTFASSGRVRDPVVTGMHGRHMSARPCRALLPCECAKLGWQTRLLAQRRSRTAPLPKPMWMVYSATVLPSCLSCSDVLFCHRPDPDTPIEETVRAMNWVLNQVRCGEVYGCRKSKYCQPDWVPAMSQWGEVQTGCFHCMTRTATSYDMWSCFGVSDSMQTLPSTWRGVDALALTHQFHAMSCIC